MDNTDSAFENTGEYRQARIQIELEIIYIQKLIPEKLPEFTLIYLTFYSNYVFFIQVREECL